MRSFILRSKAAAGCALSTALVVGCSGSPSGPDKVEAEYAATFTADLVESRSGVSGNGTRWTCQLRFSVSGTATFALFRPGEPALGRGEVRLIETFAGRSGPQQYCGGGDGPRDPAEFTAEVTGSRDNLHWSQSHRNSAASFDGRVTRENFIVGRFRYTRSGGGNTAVLETDLSLAPRSSR